MEGMARKLWNERPHPVTCKTRFHSRGGNVELVVESFVTLDTRAISLHGQNIQGMYYSVPGTTALH